MRFRDIQNQTAWMKKCEVNVISVGEPEESQYGWCQVIEVNGGQDEIKYLNVFLDDLMGQVQMTETGTQYYDILWDRDKEYYKGRPALAPPKETLNATAHKPTDWDAKDRRIARQSCLRTAAIYARERKCGTDDMLEFAEEMYAWVYKNEV